MCSLCVAASKHACRFYGCGRTDSFNFMVMQMADKSLADRRRERPGYKHGLGTVLRVGLQTLAAIRDVHKAGFLHR